ncbi:hypothetical protein SLA2020_108230 [Shorea laevis]
MNCFPCFSSQKSKKTPCQKEHEFDANEAKSPGNRNEEDVLARTFNFRELATATKNFRQECLLGEGGFGRVYKGTFQATGQVVAVKQLDRNSLQESTDFVTEVSSWSKIHHQNLVNLIGYCADGDQRLLVYEFMPGGSLEDHLCDVSANKKSMDWVTRMKIAFGAAQALEYLHDQVNPSIIYRDLKSSNVLLDEEMNPKLCHFGLSKLFGDKMPMQVMETYGFCAPEYSRSDQLTPKADVYSFGVILLELITGRRALDTTKPIDEQNLVAWATPIFKDPKKYPDMADPFLNKRFPERGLNQAVAIAAMCLQEESAVRPFMSDVVTVLSFLAVATEEKIPTALPPAISSKLSLIIKDESSLELISQADEDDDSSKSSETESDQEEEEEDDLSHQEESDFSSRQSSWRSEDGSVSSSEKSRRKGSKKSLFSMSSKNSDYGSFSSSNKGSKGSMYSSSHKSSKKSHDSSSDEESLEGNASLRRRSTKKSKGSRKSKGKPPQMDRISRRRSLEESECSTSSQRSQRRSHKGSASFGSSNKGRAHLDRNSSKGSYDGSVHSS